MISIETIREWFLIANAQLKIGMQLELHVSTGQGRCFDVAKGVETEFNLYHFFRLTVRVLKENSNSQSQGCASSTTPTLESFLSAVKRASAIAEITVSSTYLQIPPPSITSQLCREDVDRLAILDPSVLTHPKSDIFVRLKQLEKKYLNMFPLLSAIIRSKFTEYSTQTYILNSNDLVQQYSSSRFSLSIGCLAERKLDKQEGGFSVSKRLYKDLDQDDVFLRASQSAIHLLSGKQVSSGKIPIVFSPQVAAEFFSLITSATSAENIRKNSSFLKDKIGQKVASDLVNFVDNGLLPSGFATSPFDAEGCCPQNNYVIQDGYLKTYLYDYRSALEDGTFSTGNAVRSKYKVYPHVGPTNFYLQSGSISPQKIIADTTGIYLYEVMGLHMADPISGEFSVGVMGTWIQNGTFDHGVRGVIISSSMSHLLQNIDAIGTDLEFFENIGSPTFRVQNLDVSGT